MYHLTDKQITILFALSEPDKARGYYDGPTYGQGHKATDSLVRRGLVTRKSSYADPKITRDGRTQAGILKRMIERGALKVGDRPGLKT